jgi:hypothetical protein
VMDGMIITFKPRQIPNDASTDPMYLHAPIGWRFRDNTHKTHIYGGQATWVALLTSEVADVGHARADEHL